MTSGTVAFLAQRAGDCSRSDPSGLRLEKRDDAPTVAGLQGFYEASVNPEVEIEEMP